VRGPRNSVGKPWTGETWRCTRCDAAGDDRDDRPLSGCAAHPSRLSWAPHHLVFEPGEHHADVVTRRRVS
jgi:hypothetical protein